MVLLLVLWSKASTFLLKQFCTSHHLIYSPIHLHILSDDFLLIMGFRQVNLAKRTYCTACLQFVAFLF